MDAQARQELIDSLLYYYHYDPETFKNRPHEVKVRLAEEHVDLCIAKELHVPDDDLICYHQNNNDPEWSLDDLLGIRACCPGEADGPSWFWLHELRDGRIVLTAAWCDYTGWD